MDDGIVITSGYDKPHHRVLKPPGGETHDIFGQNTGGGGGGGGDHGNQRGRNRGHLQSNIFDDGHVDVPAAGRPANGNAAAGASAANGNVNRIFGNGSMEADGGTPVRKVKDYHKSNIFGIGDDPEAMNANLNTSHRRPNVNNHEMLSAVGTAYTPTKRRQFNQQVQQGYGNPITGEGYANGSAKLENGNVGTRGRNPPGGHSTNLW